MRATPSRSSTPVEPAAQASATIRSRVGSSTARTSNRRASWLTFVLALLLFASPGCYYGHLAAGQTRLLLARRDVDAVLADATTSEQLRVQLELAADVRAFAKTLGLEVDGQYTSYVDWPGDRVVTTVVATRAHEVEPAGFWFPIVGRVPYKGFFDPARADAEADALRGDGLDVCVVPVAAYSTLGWLDDPLTSPMLARGDDALVETLLHELVHATVFVESEPILNEGAAHFFGEEASIAFFAQRDPQAAARRRRQVIDGRMLDAVLNDLRSEVAALYASGQYTRADREALGARARATVAGLPFSEFDGGEIADRLRLNDACLALQGTYVGDLAEHERVLAEVDGDLRAYLARLHTAAQSDDARAAFFAN